MNMNTVMCGWKNKSSTAKRACSCGTWKNHWLNHSEQVWPSYCSVYGCVLSPSLGAHVYNPSVSGEQIVPMCHQCNGLNLIFNLNAGVTSVSANQSQTCG